MHHTKSLSGLKYSFPQLSRDGIQLKEAAPYKINPTSNVGVQKTKPFASILKGHLSWSLYFDSDAVQFFLFSQMCK